MISNLKVEIRLQDAHEDLLNSFAGDNVRSSTSFSIDPDDFEIIKFSDTTNFGNDISTEFDELENSPIGLLVPIFLINKDRDKVVVLYKEGDGTNVARYSEKIDGKWIRNEIRKEGRPIPDIDSIDLD
ncbi:MAG: hypothetical protein ACFWUA_06740 [Sporanaerobacter sp.]|uniref:hypothetical protein n=1 Tax=Sporanaerobacter sp. TaxID=2010183 RepID=UPI003A1030E8